MNNEHEKQLNTLKSINLSEREKTEMRDSLMHFIAAHPHVEHSQVSRFFSREKFILSPYSGISMRLTKVVAFSFIGLLLTGGSLTIASANSIPGEILYPIKINIQEPIEGAGKTKPAEKLEWQTKKLTRRLNEIKKLSEKKEITKEEVVIAQAVLKEHVQDLTDTINTIKQDETTSGLILSGSAELLTLSETINTSQATLSAVATTDAQTESTEQVTTSNTPDATITETTPVNDAQIVPDISSITEDTTQSTLKEILTHEVDLQITDIKRTVETVAQDTETTTPDTSIIAPKTDEKTEVIPEIKDITQLNTATLPETTPTNRAEVKGTDKKTAPTTTHTQSKKLLHILPLIK